ncbi:MAG TPA: fructosamine kinase family protein [Niabella sp.]|nr:fructosamine kinase family protein [Niabella sp.]
MNLQAIFNQLDIPVQQTESVHGGDINNAWCIYADDKKYFLKTNSADRFPGMFEKEANGLAVLRQHSDLAIPQVIANGICKTIQYLLLEWLDKGASNASAQYQFGKSIARLHQATADHFGLKEDNYIGSLMQVNTPCKSWTDFYINHRILPLVKMLADTKIFSAKDIKAAESFCASLDKVLPDEKPALLHGDLWGGNYFTTPNGLTSIFDPAVYYGHREMDIGMTRLFGGFSPEFYAGYNEIYPLQNGWEQRLSYTQLYPLLVHAVLFGGHYVSNVREILYGADI